MANFLKMAWKSYRKALFGIGRRTLSIQGIPAVSNNLAIGTRFHNDSHLKQADL